MATVHPELSSFLTDVWENRDHILFGPPAPGSSEQRETVEGRVYDIYALAAPRASSVITPNSYDAAIRALTAPGWRRSQRGGFHVWDSPLGGHVSSRLYLNVKPEHAAGAMRALFTCAATVAVPMAATTKLPPLPPASSRGLSQPDSRAEASSAMARMRRGIFADVVVAAKVADKAEAFTTRADKMVVYLNGLAGTAGVQLLATKLGSQASWFAPDIPPMTQRLAWGIAYGPEVSGAQWKMGTSFGELRCNLVAHALIEAVTGKPAASLAESTVGVLAPLPNLRLPPRVGNTPGRSPNRLDFVALVSKLFAAQGIGPQAPWAEKT